MNVDIFSWVMVTTFVAALIVLAFGIGKMGNNVPSTKFMLVRVGLCLLLLGEILIYVKFFR